MTGRLTMPMSVLRVVTYISCCVSSSKFEVKDSIEHQKTKGDSYGWLRRYGSLCTGTVTVRHILWVEYYIKITEPFWYYSSLTLTL